MKSPFPGMDPYLERPGLWEEVHRGLINGLQQFLAPLLPVQYQAAVEQRTYKAFLPRAERTDFNPNVIGTTPDHNRPDNTANDESKNPAEFPLNPLPIPQDVTEQYLEIRNAKTQEVVTVIEILSMANKRPGEGKKQYGRKRHELMSSMVHLVEVDLLRGGDPPGINDYRIVISRSDQRPRTNTYRFSFRQPIPNFSIPLQLGDKEPILNLNQILHDLYDQNNYDAAIDYSLPPPPPDFFSVDLAWIKQLIKEPSGTPIDGDHIKN